MQKKKRLLWQLYPSYVLITIISLLVVTGYASRSLTHIFLDQTASDLEARARLIEGQITQRLDPPDPKGVDLLCKSMGKGSDTRITVILPSGEVIGDSDEDPSKMDSHADRPEFIGALNASVATSTRFSRTLGRKMMYVGMPIKEGNRTIAILRTSVTIKGLGEAIKDVQMEIALVGLVIALFAAILSLMVSRRITRPIEEIRRGAEHFARGDFQAPLPRSNSVEITGLSNAMKDMAKELNNRINTIMQQRNELKAVLSSMVEGVIAVDLQEHIISTNQAAALMLQGSPAELKDRSIQEAVRNTVLQKFVSEALSNEQPIEKDIVLYSDGESILNARGTALLDAEGKRIGALIVLNDVTRLKRLENVRREFVANVSHEIKTPITTIKGFVETLREGAVHKPEDAERFLEIIHKHVDRLQAIVEDLLTLSRIEMEAEGEKITLSEAPLRDVLKTAIQVCEGKAAPKEIVFNLACDDAVVSHMNIPLLEQAVVNLLDNAVKYSRPKSSVIVDAREDRREVVISVRDQGPGIAKEHLPRLFERFYRADRGRSRRLGGTGLGLAIVKHISQAHGGRVEVVSMLGKGSTFSIHLPKNLEKR